MCLIKVCKKLIVGEDLNHGELEYEKFTSIEDLVKALKNNRFRGIIYNEDEKNTDECVKIKYDGEDMPILVNDINVIYKSKDTSIISTKTQKFVLYMSLKRLQRELKSEALIRINQCEIYPIMKIKKVEKDKVILDTGEVKKLGRRYAKEVRASIKKKNNELKVQNTELKVHNNESGIEK